MNKFRNYLLMLVFTSSAMFFTACPPDNDMLSVTPQEIEFAADDSSEQFAVVVSNTNWAPTPSSGWIKIGEKSDGRFAVSVEKYTNTTDPRNGVIIVTAGKAVPVSVNIKQRAAVKNTLTVSPTSFTFAANPTGAQTATITTNASSWIVSPGSAGWLTLEKAGNTLKVSASTNTGSQRTASITVTAGNADPVTVTVTQAGSITDPNYLNVDQQQMNFLNTAGSKPLQITANVAWQITSDQVWCTVSNSSGSGNATVNVTVNAYTGTADRTATLTVANSVNGLNKKVTVTQLGVNPSITISPTTKEIGAGAETINVAVSANVEFDVTPNVAWISVTQITATAVTLQAQANAASTRTGRVTFKQKDGNESKTLTINQAGGHSVVIPSNVICVSFEGNDANDGKSWNTAKKTINEAISIAPPGGEVWVEKGHYDQTLVMKNGINVYGGFNRTEGSISERGTTKSTSSIIMNGDFITPTVIDGFHLPGGTLYKNGILNNSEITMASYGVGFELQGGTISNTTINHSGNSYINNYYGGKILNSYIKSTSTTVQVLIALMNDNCRIEGCIIEGPSSALINSSGSGTHFVVNCTFIMGSRVVKAAGNSSIIYANNISISIKNTGANILGGGYATKNLEIIEAEILYHLNKDYSPKSNSPVVNSGDNSHVTVDKDILGNPRIQNGKVDIGAIESSF